MLDLRVQLGEAGLVLRQVVVGAVVCLGVPVLRAVHVGALAGHLHESDLFAAQPALVQVRLRKQKQFLILASSERKERQNLVSRKAKKTALLRCFEKYTDASWFDPLDCCLCQTWLELAKRGS